MSSLSLLVSRFRFPLFRRYLSTQTSNIKSRNDLPTNLRQPNDPTVMPVLDASQLSEAEQIYVKRFEERHMRNVERRHTRTPTSTSYWFIIWSFSYCYLCLYN